MRGSIVWVVAIGACGGEGTPAGQETPTTTAFSVSIGIDSGAIYNLHAGDQVRLSAVVRDLNHAIIPDAPVTWSSIFSYRATVASDGLVTIPVNPGSGDVSIMATSGNATASFILGLHDWSFGGGVAQLGAVTTGENAIGIVLMLACRNGVFELGLLSPPVTAIGPRLVNTLVTTQFDGAAPTLIAWQLGESASKISAPNPATALALADRMLTADTLRIRYNFTVGGTQESVFRLGDAENVVGPATAACR